MIGYYNYTVWLTYVSLISAGTGIFVSLNGKGHPYIGVFFLLISGLCDAFDGKVARTKKDRTKSERNFGIQVDSLCDLVAFGVLPASIGVAMFRRSRFLDAIFTRCEVHSKNLITFVVFAIFILYILAAMIRLAYFNITEEERQNSTEECRKNYTGLPVTSAALIFPTILLFHFLLPKDITLIYFAVMLIVAFLFVSKISVKKPDTKGILILIGIGAVEFVLLIVLKLLLSR